MIYDTMNGLGSILPKPLPPLICIKAGRGPKQKKLDPKIDY